MRIRRISGESWIRGRLPVGCRLCRLGAKMVLFVSGLCPLRCWYCPVSRDRFRRDVTFADELRVHSDEDVLLEARSIGARGTGVTGGDPLFVVEKTVHYIELLKGEFGPSHHIHLYTAIPDLGALRRVADAGLDELRLHPVEYAWTRMGGRYEEFLREALDLGLTVGLEIPAIPGRGREIARLIEFADSLGLSFVNMNELELSDSNAEALLARGLRTKSDVDYGIEGSEEAAREAVKLTRGLSITVHYCSAYYKGAVQMRNRLRRRARRVARPFELPTEDGTLLFGVLVTPRVGEALRVLEEEGVPRELYEVRGMEIVLAPWVLLELWRRLPGEGYLVEAYPTEDRMVVEQVPVEALEGEEV